MFTCRASSSQLQQLLLFCSQANYGNTRPSFCSFSDHSRCIHTSAVCNTSGHSATGSSTSSVGATTTTSSDMQQHDSSSSHQPVQTTSGTRPPPKPHSSLDKKEAAKFAALSDKWWDKARGPFAPLHALNPARCRFLRQGVCSSRGLDHSSAEPLLGLSALDVGCGGGLLSEAVARMGADVHGIDVSDEGIAAAAAHATGDPLLQQRVRWVGRRNLVWPGILCGLGRPQLHKSLGAQQHSESTSVSVLSVLSHTCSLRRSLGSDQSSKAGVALSCCKVPPMSLCWLSTVAAYWLL